MQPGVSVPELYCCNLFAKLTIAGPSPVVGVIFGVIGIVRPSMSVSAAWIVEAIGHGFDPLARFNFAGIS